MKSLDESPNLRTPNPGLNSGFGVLRDEPSSEANYKIVSFIYCVEQLEDNYEQ
jgi:hypothetical protein